MYTNKISSDDWKVPHTHRYYSNLITEGVIYGFQWFINQNFSNFSYWWSVAILSPIPKNKDPPCSLGHFGVKFMLFLSHVFRDFVQNWYSSQYKSLSQIFKLLWVISLQAHLWVTRASGKQRAIWREGVWWRGAKKAKLDATTCRKHVAEIMQAYDL